MMGVRLILSLENRSNASNMDLIVSVCIPFISLPCTMGIKLGPSQRLYQSLSFVSKVSVKSWTVSLLVINSLAYCCDCILFLCALITSAILILMSSINV